MAVEDSGDTVFLKEWIWTLIVTVIPVVNIVMAFVWAFGGGTKPSKRNFFKAYLILAAAGLILSVVFSAIGLFSLSNLFGSFGNR